MKRDMELVRKILIDVSEGETPERLKDSEKNGKYLYHLEIMKQANLITCKIASYYDGFIYIENPKLTWEGNDYLDSLSDKEVWENTKRVINEKGLELAAVPIDVIIELAKLQVKKIFGIK